MTVLRPNQTLVSENENDRKNRIFGFSQQITPDVSTTFTSFTTFFCSPPLDFLSHALTENFRDAYPLTELRGPVCKIFDKCQFVGKRPKKRGWGNKTFHVRLKKLVIKSVDPVDGRRSVSARGSDMFLRGPVCIIFDKCQFVGKRKK